MYIGYCNVIIVKYIYVHILYIYLEDVQNADGQISNSL